jgi:hypothetical protein
MKCAAGGFFRKTVFILTCAVLPIASCVNYDEDKNCEHEPASCNQDPPKTGTLSVNVTINSENPSVAIYVYEGSDIETGTLILTDSMGKATVTSTEIMTYTKTLPIGKYCATATYSYEGMTVQAVDSGSIDVDSQTYCEGTCYDISNAELNLELDTAALKDFKSGNKDKCFIATAAFGSPMHEKVRVLRNFRDRFLLPNAAGRAFVGWYYRTSPPIAGYIGEHETVRSLVRYALIPLIFSIEHPCIVFIAGLIALFMIVFRRRAKELLGKAIHRQ